MYFCKKSTSNEANLLALRVGEMCGTTILTSIGLSFLFLRGLLTFSNDTMAYHFASAIRYCQLALLNMKSRVASSRNTTIPRFIWYIPFSFEHLRLFKTPLWRCVLTPTYHTTIPHSTKHPKDSNPAGTHRLPSSLFRSHPCAVSCARPR